MKHFCVMSLNVWPMNKIMSPNFKCVSGASLRKSTEQ